MKVKQLIISQVFSLNSTAKTVSPITTEGDFLLNGEQQHIVINSISGANINIVES